MYRKWSTFVLLALATPTLALAQSTGKLQGRVIERGQTDGTPGVTITIEGTQLGAVTDVDGNYTILGIPVGTYTVRAELAGYSPVLVRNVEINSNSTRTLDFTLQQNVADEVVVTTFERPLIQNDAITTGRAISGQTIENLPVRGVNAVVATQAAVVSSNQGLNIRGGRGGEVATYVDGVRVIGNLGVPQQAIQEQELILGTIPARYGDVQSGVINITTKSGLSERFFGSAEAITSQFLDPYGYNLGSLSVGGPIVRNRATFFVSGEYTSVEDGSPYNKTLLQLSDADYADLQANPQSIAAVNAQGERVYVTLPGDIGAGTTRAALIQRLTDAGLIGGTTGLSIPSTLNIVPFSRAETFTAANFTETDSKRAPSNSLAVTGNITVRPFGSTNLRFGGTLVRGSGDSYSYGRSLYNRDQWSESESGTWRVFGDLRQSFNRNRGFFQLNASWEDYQSKSYPKGFGSDIQNILFYGDVDGLQADGVTRTIAYDLNAVARNYYNFNNTTGVFSAANRDGVLPGSVYSLFSLPGSGVTGYSQSHTQQFRTVASATWQIGAHQLEAGAEYEQSIRRAYSSGGASFATFYNDGNVEAGASAGVDRYEQLPFTVVGPRASWYGYDFLGLNEVDSGNFTTFGQDVANTPANGNIAPWKPYYYAGYIQDKVEYRDLVIQVGFRADAFNTNTMVPIDPFALEPIVRAGDLSGVTLPSNIGSNFAVYYAGSVNTGAIAGYRDLNGVYYTANGTRTTFEDLDRAFSSPGVVSSGAAYETAFQQSETQVTLMPRVGVSFPVTDQALFFASYNVTGQRPTEAAFYPAERFKDLSNGRISNPNLKPERTTQYELGFRQRLGDNAALQISGFYRTQQNKIGVRTVQNSFPARVTGYSTYFNIDFTTTKGATIEFDLRRVRGLQATANYTIAFAQGTGSDANTAGTIAWRGNYYPDFLAPSSFDRRHSLNVNLDYRLGQGEGPMIGGRHLLENFGVNILAVLQSGLPYTQLTLPNNFPVYASFTENITGSLNGAYTPWTNRIDMRIDRTFALRGRVGLNLFLNVQNLLNTRNVFGVYRNTGLVDSDGFLNSAAGQQLAAQQANANSFAFHYDYATSNPNGAGSSFSNVAGGVGSPRNMRLGLRLTF